MKLTVKQEKFCNKYIECGNASEAYRFAYGCKKMKDETINRTSFDLLNNHKVTARIDELKAELKAKSDITKERILEEMSAILEAKITDYLEFDGTSIKFKNFNTLTERQVRAIESIKEGKNGIELKLHGKNWSIDRICKMLGFDAPVVMEQRLNTGFEEVKDEDLKEKLMTMINIDERK